MAPLPGEVHDFFKVLYPGDTLFPNKEGTPQFLPVFFGWINEPGYGDGVAAFNDSYGQGIRIESGESARVLGPVYDYGTEFFRTRGTAMKQVEFDSPGFSQVVDSTPLDVTRTLEIRVSNTKFYQTDVSPAWTTINRNEVIDFLGRYVQYRVTLTLNAV